MGLLGYLGIIAGIFFGDMWIKNYIERTGVENETRSLLDGKLLIRRHHNRGAIFNKGQDRRQLVAVLSVLLTLSACVAFIISLGNKGNRMLRLGLALLLGGAFSNTYDRLKRKYVVDYFSFGVPWKRLRKVIFNLSDFGIIIGALLMTLGVGR